MRERTTKDCIEFQGINDEGYFVLTDNSLMELLNIKTKDLNALSKDEMEYDALKLSKIYKLDSADVKIISMNFPCNTSEQQNFLKRKMEKTDNEVYRHFLKTYLNELVWLQKKDTTREFYLCIFAKNSEILGNHVRRWLENLGHNKNGMLKQISNEKKIDIYNRLNNKCIMVRG